MAAAVAIARSNVRTRFDYVAIIASLAVLSFLVGRLDAFFVVAVVILLAPQLGTLQTMRESAKSAVRQPGFALITIVATIAVVVPVARFVAPYVTWAADYRAAGRRISRRHGSLPKTA